MMLAATDIISIFFFFLEQTVSFLVNDIKTANKHFILKGLRYKKKILKKPHTQFFFFFYKKQRKKSVREKALSSIKYFKTPFC